MPQKSSEPSSRVQQPEALNGVMAVAGSSQAGRSGDTGSGEVTQQRLLQMIDFYRHRIVASEAALREAGCVESLPKRHIQVRMDRLAALRGTLDRLCEQFRLMEPHRSLPPEFAVLRQATYEETEIFIKSLWERQSSLKELCALADGALKLQRDAMAGRNSYFRSTFRLSKLSKMMMHLEAKLRNLILDDRAMSRLVRKIFGRLVSPDAIQINRFLFQTYEGLTRLESDISRLQAQSGFMGKRLRKMRRWLDAEETKMEAMTPLDQAFDLSQWPSHFDNPLARSLAAEQEVLKVFNMAHQYEVVAHRKRQAGPVTQKIIREGKIG